MSLLTKRCIFKSISLFVPYFHKLMHRRSTAVHLGAVMWSILCERSEECTLRRITFSLLLQSPPPSVVHYASIKSLAGVRSVPPWCGILHASKNQTKSKAHAKSEESVALVNILLFSVCTFSPFFFGVKCYAVLFSRRQARKQSLAHLVGPLVTRLRKQNDCSTALKHNASTVTPRDTFGSVVCARLGTFCPNHWQSES